MEDIHIEKTYFYRIISYLNIFVTGFFLIFFIWTMLDAPQIIPMHYNLKGEITRYGNKSELWILFVFICITQLILLAVKKYPYLWNVPSSKNDENRQKQYQLTAHFLCCLQLFISVLFFMIYIAILYKPNEIGFFIYLPLGILFIVLIIYLFKVYKLRK